MLRWIQRPIAACRLRLHGLQRHFRTSRPNLHQVSPTSSQPARSFFHWPPRTRPARWLIITANTLLAGHIFVTFFMTVASAWGVSMVPTFMSFGDWVFISMYYRRGRDVKVGDVVSFKHPIRPGEHAIKRVIGMEGDFVLMYTPEVNETMIQVPEGHCWVAGDNLKWSRDSRMFGPLPLALIQGKVQARLNLQDWAFDFAWIEHDLQPGHHDDDDLD